MWYNCPRHHPLTNSDFSKAVVAPKPKPRAKSAGASAQALSKLQPSIASRPCIGPALQQRFPRLRALVSESLRVPSLEHTATSSTQPYPPDPLPSSDDVPIPAPDKAESANPNKGQEDDGTLKGNERRVVVSAGSAESSASPAALAAPLLQAAPFGPPRASADAHTSPAPRK